MPNIVLTRIDNRLIHGQVATMWSSSVGANLTYLNKYNNLLFYWLILYINMINK